jgi:hypothetical protein
VRLYIQFFKGDISLVEYDYDIFISYASEDREDIARPLVDKLIEAGLRVWYDQNIINIGNIISKNIKKGLASSRYGVVILSPNYFMKRWPKQELDELTAKENELGEEVVLPVLYNTTGEEATRYWPLLADKNAAILAKEGEEGIEEIAQRIIRVFKISNNLIKNSILTKKPSEEVLPEKYIKKTVAKITQPFHPEELFIDKLYLIRQPNALPGAETEINGLDNLKYNGEPVTPILPFTKEILPLLDNQLYQRIRFESTGNGYKIKLLLPAGVKTSNGNTEIEHEYSHQSNEIVFLENLPTLEIWPNFKTKSWHFYYIYFAITKPFNSFYVEPVIFDGQSEHVCRKSKNEFEYEIARMTGFPKAFFCETTGDKNSVMGIILMKQANTPPPATKSWRVGIDFRNQETSVFVKEEDVYPKSLKITDLTMPVIKPASKGFNLNKYFIQDYINQAFPFFNNFFHAHMGLKWSSDKDERKRVLDFLEQLSIQCMAEAAVNGIKKINFYLSYPESLLVDERNDFMNALGTICREYHKITGLQLEVHPGMSETKALACFFTTPPYRAHSGSVFIFSDLKKIDISIWGGFPLERQYHSTFPYKCILWTMLYHNIELLDKFKVPKQDQHDLKRIIEPKIFCTKVYGLFCQNENDILQQLTAFNDDRVIMEMMTLLTVELAGVFYYLGLILKDLYLKENNQPSLPKFFIGGTWISILKLISRDHYSDNSPINYVLHNIICSATNNQFGEKLKLKLSDYPRSEIACGLVSDSNFIQCRDDMNGKEETTTKEFGTHHFEIPWNGEQTFDWNAIVDEIQRELSKLDSFIDIFNRLADSTNLLKMNTNGEIFMKIHSKISELFCSVNSSQTDIIFSEPLFITALQIYLDIIVEKWAENIRRKIPITSSIILGKNFEKMDRIISS